MSGLTINHNLLALTASNNLSATYSALSKSVNRLSSGLRINNSSDDAAGLAVSELMRSEVAVLNQGVRNANDAVSMLQTMDGAAQVIDEKLIRMKELSEQAATGTYSSTQRSIMNSEFQQMADEIERIAQATDFNGVKMLNTTSGGVTQVVALDGSARSASNSIKSWWTTAGGAPTLSSLVTIRVVDHAGNVRLREISGNATLTALKNRLTSISGVGTATYSAAVGTFFISAQSAGVSDLYVQLMYGNSAPTSTISKTGVDGRVKIHFGTGNDSAEDYYYVDKQDMTKAGLGINGLSISAQGRAQCALTTIDAAITAKDRARANFGAMMNRLANTVTNLTVQGENIQAAESGIRDVDVATEMTNYTNTQIKAQAAVAILAQANALPRMALTLLGV